MKNQSHPGMPERIDDRRRSFTSGLRDTMVSFRETLKHSLLAHPSFDGTIAFGPVPSRRLGQSLGINNMKHKICTYDCLYCQAGRTTTRSTCRDCNVSPYEMYFFVKEKVEQLEDRGIRIDYISFVPNGEPTLDINLSKEIVLLRDFGYKVAVFTNSSLLWNDNVKESLLFADYVSVKVDTINEATWETLNRPHRGLRFDRILHGIEEFAKSYGGVLTTETMLVRNVNDTLEKISQVGDFLNGLTRSAAYFTIPIRPPAERGAVPPDADVLETISEFVKDKVPHSEMLCHPESGEFSGTGSMEEELLAILAVHPVREDSMEKIIRRYGCSRDHIEEMVRKGLIQRVTYEGKQFYVMCDQ